MERTISTTNTDKFGQAICAFANDLPNNNRPGFLILGAEDNGKIHPLQITDELLKNIAAIRTDGNIQPQPSMTVQKVSLEEGDIIVVEVHPAKFPPVKYKGRIWVRIGPRRGIANEDDERRLYEKRAANITTFDAMPCIGATLDDLDLAVFKQQYLPKAIPEDVLQEDKRDVEWQLQSLGFFDKRYNCPTYAGILFFGKQVERFLPGAYIQYVRFEGQGRAGKIKSEYKFSGNLCKVLFQLDTFVDVSITNRRPVPVSALQEKTVIDYPHWATRELLMNAICHRSYESNGPIQFYQYDNRIELMNPGGLYGKANAQNFPLVNDYRNPIVAETMKVLGFVNRFSRGVLRVKEELKENGNGDPQFSLDLGTAFMVTEPISAEALLYPCEAEGEEKSEEKEKHNNINDNNLKRKKEKYKTKSEEKAEEKNEEKSEEKEKHNNINDNNLKRKKEKYKTKSEEKAEEKSEEKAEEKSEEKAEEKSEEKSEEKEKHNNINDNNLKRKKEKYKTKSEEKSEEKNTLTETEQNILKILAIKPEATYAFISEKLKVSETSTYNTIKKLKSGGWIKREDGRKHGKWTILKTVE